MLLAFDDTDGPEGGCTTAVAFQVLEALPELALLEPPRLVRLNPNAPWKTRGNGAVCLRLGRPGGRRVVVGEWQGRPVYAYPEGDDIAPRQDHIDRAWDVVRLEGVSNGAAPALVGLATPPPERVYWDAVRRLVPLSAVPRGAAWSRHEGDGRGLVGAIAAAAWQGPRVTFELLAYRIPRHIGARRHVDEDALIGLDDRGLFGTYDASERRMACIPNTPCPVLLGLRARRAADLHRHAVPALRAAAREPVAGWLMWRTNQASGDHIRAIKRLRHGHAGSTIALDVTVTGEPETRRGGHVFVPAVTRDDQAIWLVAFEPSRSFRHVARALRPGDAVTAIGGLAWSPGEDAALHLEKLRLSAPVAVRRKVANPQCDVCDIAMKSVGAAGGYKCPRCRQRAPVDAALYEIEDRVVEPGWYEPPVMARRHLHRPLAWGDPAGAAAD